jgi:hypothetical protein
LERDVFAPPSSGFFVGPAFDLGAVDSGPFPFDVTLTDVAGNTATVALPASALFRGFIGPVPLISGSLAVSVYDPGSLFPLSNATVFVENLGGGDEARGTTGSDGSVTFAGRTGAQTVTVFAEERQAVTVFGCMATELSLPLPLTSEPVVAPSAGISGVTSGVGTVAGNLLAEADALQDADGVQTVDLGQLFGGGLTARLQRLGWYAAFHEIEAFPAVGSYFRFFGRDAALLLEPSTSGSVTSPQLPLEESTNQIFATTDYQYPVTVVVGSGFDAPVATNGALAFARVPGLDGLAGVGAGAVSGASGTVEVELELHGEAVAQGAPASEVIIQVHAEDDDGDFALARATETFAAAPAPVVLTLPGIPEANAAWTGAAYPFTRSFSSTLAAGEGYYRAILKDDRSPAGAWQIWIPASVGLSGSILLPTLKESPTGAVGTPPLATAPGTVWNAFFEAYRMPAGFVEIGFFWSSLYRDATGFARSVAGPDLQF